MLGMTPSHGQHITGNYATLGYTTFYVLGSFLIGVQVREGVSVSNGRCPGDSLDRLPPTQQWGALNVPPDLSHSDEWDDLLTTAIDLLNTLDFLNDFQKQEIMFRSNSSKEPLAPELAW
jgi:hypothetical protein